jgi:succinate-semialdehyde dehydrogenase/glutarate-semialdehyde dehydrogenase
MSTIKSINPYNGEVNAEFELLTDEQINEKIEIANNAYLQWSKTSFEYRKKIFYKLAEVIEADLEKYAKLQTIEM